jgi:CRISPR-associated exonuclease Cas4
MTGTHINYYFLCKRKLWLFANNMQMEHTSDTVATGRVISDTSYTRKRHELRIDDISLDFYDARTRTIHEIKKSPAMEQSHIRQVQYYISVLESKGVEGVSGMIDYPLLKRKVRVLLTEEDREEIQQIEKDIHTLIALPSPPPTIDKPFCKKCSYYELCYV